MSASPVSSLTIVRPARRGRARDGGDGGKGEDGGRERAGGGGPLPGMRVRIGDATWHDYLALARHHYCPRPPATRCAVRGVWVREAARGADDPFDAAPARPRLVAVAVLSWPVPMLRARCRHFALPMGGAHYRACLRFANAQVRTVSRVIVHPQFRALGLATRLVRDLARRCPTRYVEASAHMGGFSDVFARAGFVRHATPPHEPAYFLLDRAA